MIMENELKVRLEKVIQNAEILDKRAYLTIDDNGNIKRKKMNYIIPALVYCDDNLLFEEILKSESDPKEREKEKKIQRLSNLDIKKVKSNFMKLVIKGELEFAKKYGKELALREVEEFKKMIFELSLMDNIEFNKPLMALAFIDILEKNGWNDEIGYLVISYFTKQRYDLHKLEYLEEKTEDINEIPNILNIVAYKKVLDAYNYENKNKYRAILIDACKNLEVKNTNLKIENEILKNIKL